MTNAITAGHVTYYENYCVVSPEIEYDEMHEHLCGMANRREQSSFYIGDLLNAAEERFGETAAQLTANLGYSYSSLALFKTVARRFPPEHRLPGLTFKHYRAASPWHNAIPLLEQAAREHLSVEEMKALRPINSHRPLPMLTNTTSIRLYVLSSAGNAILDPGQKTEIKGDLWVSDSET